MNYELKLLPKDTYQGYVIPMETRNQSYYDVEISSFEDKGCSINLIKKTAEEEIIHTSEEYDFPDRLYPDYWPESQAYGIIGDDGKIKACIQIGAEEWTKRLTITELWVHENFRRQGIGTLLMNKAKEIAKAQGRRAIMLETQSYNVNAISFYLAQGFQLFGFDRCCYQNDDVARREVRLNLGMFV